MNTSNKHWSGWSILGGHNTNTNNGEKSGNT